MKGLLKERFINMVNAYLEAHPETKKEDLAADMGIKGPAFSNHLNPARSTPDEFVYSFIEKYRLNRSYLDTGFGHPLSSDITNNVNIPFLKNTPKQTDRRMKSNTKYIGDLDDGMFDDDGTTKFREISPGRYRMKVPLISEPARAGFLRGFKDPEYDPDLPTTEITVDFYHKGTYKAFEVDGDSMYDGTIESLPHGMILTGREIKQELWAHDKLHSHKYPNWIFVHRYEGILTKRIASQDVEKGTIELLSLNPNKELYPNQTIEIKDIYAVYNVVKKEFS